MIEDFSTQFSLFSLFAHEIFGDYFQSLCIKYTQLYLDLAKRCERQNIALIDKKKEKNLIVLNKKSVRKFTNLNQIL